MNHTKVIGVFLPAGYRGGSLNGAKNIAKMLVLGSRKANEPVDVIFSCVANVYNIAEEFSDLLELGITVRETTWGSISRDKVRALLKFGGNTQATLHYPEYDIPISGVSYFNECDFWLIISDRLFKPLAPIKPYGMVIYDYIQRYVPQIFNASFSDTTFIATARQANFVLTTTPATKEDAIQYAGLASSRTHLAPMEFDHFDHHYDAKKIDYDFFMWPSNASPHKNHIKAIEALNTYYQDYDGELKVVMTGVNTHYFHNTDNNRSLDVHVKETIDLIEKYPLVKNNLRILGNVSTQNYIGTLKSAKFLWHPAIIDNGTYAVIEAAFYGIPSLSSDYLQMQYMNDRFKLGLNFCQAFKPRDMAMQLKKMEETHMEKRQLLPTKEFLQQFSYKNVAPEFWNLIRGLL